MKYDHRNNQNNNNNDNNDNNDDNNENNNKILFYIVRISSQSLLLVFTKSLDSNFRVF